MIRRKPPRSPQPPTGDHQGYAYRAAGYGATLAGVWECVMVGRAEVQKGDIIVVMHNNDFTMGKKARVRENAALPWVKAEYVYQDVRVVPPDEGFTEACRAARDLFKRRFTERYRPSTDPFPQTTDPFPPRFPR